MKVSPVPLDKERSGIDILSKGIWHDTYSGTIEEEIRRRISGEVDVPALEERHDTEKVAPFDNTRNMTLNITNPMVATLLGWVDQCLHELAGELTRKEKERRATEEARRLESQARQLARVLNDDFRTLQMELDKIRRLSRLQERSLTEEAVPGHGSEQTEYETGGPEHGSGSRGTSAGLGDEERLGASLLPGNEKGGPGTTSERRQPQSAFHVEYRHEEQESARSHYDSESRTIVVNLDHPQVARSVREGGGIEGKQFREMTYEIAFVEYAIALSYEKSQSDEFYAGTDSLYDLRETINRVSRLAGI